MIPFKSGRASGVSILARRGYFWTYTDRLCSTLCCHWRTAGGFFLLAIIVLGVQMGTARAQLDSESATYTVTFEGNWNTDSTPDGVVRGAHFTTLIGAVHSDDVTFWTPGEMATSGVESVAETGSTGTFEGEIRNAEQGTVKSVVRQGGTSATGTSTFKIEFSRTHPLLTLLSMIGPSPDWFVGVSGLSLLDESNEWSGSHTVDLFPYDAGTEDGEGFSLSNPATVPQENIASIRGEGSFSDTRMARLIFTLDTASLPPEEEMEETEEPEMMEEMEEEEMEQINDTSGSGGGGGGCALKGSDSSSPLGLSLVALALLLTVLLRGTSAKDHTH